MQVTLAAALATLFASLSHVAEAYLSPAMERVSAALRVPPRLAGVTLLAWANGAPDLAANVAAMRAGRINMALGAALGAGMFVTCVVGGELARMCNGVRVGAAMARLPPRSIEPSAPVQGQSFLCTRFHHSSAIHSSIIGHNRFTNSPWLQVRDVVVYTLAVAFMLYALDSGHIAAPYVALCLLAYTLYVLSVLCADFHSRGWLPHQKARRGCGGGGAARALSTPPRRAGGVSKGRTAGSPKGVRSPRGLQSLRVGGGVKKERRSGGEGVATIEALFRRGDAADALSPVASESPPPLAPVLTLPVSDGGGERGGAAHGGTRSFTSLSIEHTARDSMRRQERARGCVAVCWCSARGALAATTAPLRYVQRWSIPAASGGAGDACTWPMFVKSLLACQVQVRAGLARRVAVPSLGDQCRPTNAPVPGKFYQRDRCCRRYTFGST